MKTILVLLVGIWSSLSTAKQPASEHVCAAAASLAAIDAFRADYKGESEKVGTWVATVKQSGNRSKFLIEAVTADAECRDCYVARYYVVEMRLVGDKAKTCELVSAKPH